MTKQWAQKSIGEILQLEYGKPLQDIDRNPDGKYPVYGANGEKTRTDKFLCDKPSIIVGRKGSAGELQITTGKFWPLDVTYYAVFNENEYDLKFLYYVLSTLGLPNLARGVKPGINRNDIYALKAMVPPLFEQQRIVRLLDEAFSGITIAKANAEKNLQNTRVLFESQLQSALIHGAGRWETKSIGEVCTFTRGLTYAKTDEVRISENIVLRATNIDLATNRLVYDELKYINETFIVPDSKKVKKDSLIICMASGSKSHLGKVAMIEENSGYAFGGFMGMLTPSTSLIPKFLFRLLTSGGYRTFINSISDGANINNLTFDKLNLFNFSAPPLSEQRRIVADLDDLEMSTKRLTATYVAKIHAVDALQASMLRQAFAAVSKTA